MKIVRVRPQAFFAFIFIFCLILSFTYEFWKFNYRTKASSSQDTLTNSVEVDNQDHLALTTKLVWPSVFDDAQKVLKKEPDVIKKEIAAEKSQHVAIQEAEDRQKKLEVISENVAAIGSTGGISTDPSVKEKQDFVRNMMKHAWDGYKRFAWGANEVKPVAKKGHAGIFGGAAMGATIVDSVDTLYIMGMMDEYKEARDWIALHFKFEPRSEISIFEANIRFIGGLLSAYALTGDKVFRVKAEHVARKLLPAFDTPSGIPKSLFNVQTGASKNYNWASGGSCILAELGTLQLEWDYLSHVSGDRVFADRIQRIHRHVASIKLDSNLYSNYISPTTGKWAQQHYSLGALGDSFYEYLLKGWLLHSKQDDTQRHTYDTAAQALMDRLVQTKSGYTYVAEMKGSRLSHKMDHLACFSGGMFALGGKNKAHVETQQADGESSGRNEAFVRLGAELTRTCHLSYNSTATKIGPEAFHFEGGSLATASRGAERKYVLRPEVVESYFVLWRVTGEERFREWGWQAAQAIDTHCRKEGGFAGLQDVTNPKSSPDDVQQSFFLAETLKYLYLLFSEDTLIPLDHWVMNTEAHPIPILPT